MISFHNHNYIWELDSAVHSNGLSNGSNSNPFNIFHLFLFLFLFTLCLLFTIYHARTCYTLLLFILSVLCVVNGEQCAAKMLINAKHIYKEDFMFVMNNWTFMNASNELSLKQVFSSFYSFIHLFILCCRFSRRPTEKRILKNDLWIG